MTAAITDFSHFTDLRKAAGENDPEALREVAGQFEALFLETMLKNMRDASLGDPIFGDSDEHEMYQGMLDQQLAIEMSSGKGIGIAEMLVRQLGEQAPAPSSVGSSFGIPAVLRGEPAERQPLWSDPQEFARDVWPHAERVAERLNVAPEAVLAQAALETGWGAHVMQRQDGSSSLNLFGIKAGGGWFGDSVSKRTLEFEAGIANSRLAQFRAYDDVAATFDDYADLLSRNPRYASVAHHGDDIRGFAEALQASGYATDPLYADKLRRVAGSETMQRVVKNLKTGGDVPITHQFSAESQ